jgi:nucleoside-diphosphate-sugar epimerase
MDFFRKSFAFSIDEARELLGYNPKLGFEEGAIETARWYLTQGLL